MSHDAPLPSAFFQGLVEAAPDGIVISRNGVMLYVNPAAVRLLGYDEAAQLIGKPMTLFLDGREALAMRGRLEEMRATGVQLPPLEYPAKRRDGSSIVAEITSMFVIHEGAPAVLGFARDVTERVKMRAQLAHAERLAAIGTLAAGVAHEINNPLAFMTLAAEQVASRLETRAPEDDASKAAIKDILAGTNRIARIVRELRVYARQDDDPVGPIDLARVLEAAERIVAHELKARATLAKTLPELPPVLGTATQLEQVFVNLLLNAAHAMGPDRADGKIELAARVGEGSVIVEVVDDGQGIPAGALARVFEPFFTTKPSGAGTGLGLSICRDIVLRLGGDLVARSEPGRTTFTVTLPRATEPVRPRTSTTPPAPDSGVRRRVLIIDDEPSIVSLVTDTLSERHDVVGATDPESGLACILSSEGPFDVVLCDLMMPVMSGMELHARVARERPGLEQRIVFATGGPSTERAREFLATIPNRRLMKPFSAKELEQCIQAVAADHR